MKSLLTTPLFSITVTLGIFLLAQKLYRRFGTPLLNPVFISILALICLLNIFSVPYEKYFDGARIIHFFLGVSVVALGLTIHHHFDTILRMRKLLFFSILGGSVAGIASAAGIAFLLHAPKEVWISLAPKSATAPISMAIAGRTGGIPELTGAVTILVGVFGAVAGPFFLRLIGIRSATAFGIAMGAASHGIGTARAIEEGSVEGAASALALCLNGIATALLTPLFLRFFV